MLYSFTRKSHEFRQCAYSALPNWSLRLLFLSFCLVFCRLLLLMCEKMDKYILSRGLHGLATFPLVSLVWLRFQSKSPPMLINATSIWRSTPNGLTTSLGELICSKVSRFWIMCYIHNVVCWLFLTGLAEWQSDLYTLHVCVLLYGGCPPPQRSYFKTNAMCRICISQAYTFTALPHRPHFHRIILLLLN